jgi:hypothetical protein
MPIDCSKKKENAGVGKESKLRLNYETADDKQNA